MRMGASCAIASAGASCRAPILRNRHRVGASLLAHDVTTMPLRERARAYIRTVVASMQCNGIEATVIKPPSPSIPLRCIEVTPAFSDPGKKPRTFARQRIVVQCQVC